MPASPTNLHALILAGGSGTRFWPLSRNHQPKQLLPLFDESTLLEKTLDRLDGLVAPENTLILTNHLQEAAVRKLASRLPSANILAEPARRDTAPAVALGIGLVAARDPEATMLVVSSDQLIHDVAGFQSVMRDAATSAGATDALVTVGIKPTWACPSFGYIERGERVPLSVPEIANPPYRVKRFREKPSVEQAAEFLRHGGFLWNAGMFIWSIPAVISELNRHAPELATFVTELRQAANPAATIAERFPLLTPISVDYALMEKSDRVLCIESIFDWDDVGSWPSIAKYLEPVGADNRCRGPVTEIGSANNIVFNGRPGTQVALLGVNDLIVVQTEDAVLVANRHQADAIKKLCDRLPPEFL